MFFRNPSQNWEPKGFGAILVWVSRNWRLQMRTSWWDMRRHQKRRFTSSDLRWMEQSQQISPIGWREGRSCRSRRKDVLKVKPQYLGNILYSEYVVHNLFIVISDFRWERAQYQDQPESPARDWGLSACSRSRWGICWSYNRGAHPPDRLSPYGWQHDAQRSYQPGYQWCG